MTHALAPRLATDRLDLAVVARRYQDAHRLEEASATLADGAALTLGPATWRCALTVATTGEASDFTVTITLVAGELKAAAVGVRLRVRDWDRQGYLAMPAGAYAGNRFRARRLPYSPRVEDPADIGGEAPTVISDIPRLADGPGPSQLQLLSRDLATPAFGVHRPNLGAGLGLWLLLPPEPSDRLMEAAEDGDHLDLTVLTPGVREGLRYQGCMTTRPSEDRAHAWAVGDTVELRLRLVRFRCADVPALWARFADVRKDLAPGTPAPATLPFSAAAALIGEKYARDNWNTRLGFLQTQTGGPDTAAGGEHWGAGYHHVFSTGWCGGAMVEYPLAVLGDEAARARCARSHAWFYAGAPSACGLFHGKSDGAQWFADAPWRVGQEHWHLVRRSCDVLYYGLRHLSAGEARGETAPVVSATALRSCADALVRIWDTDGQFGQWIDQHRGTIVVGGSACAGLAPGALALAWQRWGDPAHLRVARASGRAFVASCLRPGVTTGGPGDALQNPDSESVGALVESYAALHDATGADEWLDAGRMAAHQLTSWVMTHDHAFPPASLFGRLDMRSTGTVFANLQNKHSAPGLCTHSGLGLLRLFRATSETALIDLLLDIARSLPQFVSRPDRPVGEMPSGWINERVNTSDWAEPMGEIFRGSTWAEVAALLTFAEVPGVYARPDLGRVWAFDHVEATIVGSGVEVRNPTAHPALVAVLIEDAGAAAKPLPAGHATRMRRIAVPPGGSIRVADAQQAAG